MPTTASNTANKITKNPDDSVDAIQKRVTNAIIAGNNNGGLRNLKIKSSKKNKLNFSE